MTPAQRLEAADAQLANLQTVIEQNHENLAATFGTGDIIHDCRKIAEMEATYTIAKRHRDDLADELALQPTE
jgi:hypothetical protein